MEIVEGEQEYFGWCKTLGYVEEDGYEGDIDGSAKFNTLAGLLLDIVRDHIPSWEDYPHPISFEAGMAAMFHNQIQCLDPSFDTTNRLIPECVRIVLEEREEDR